MPTRLLSRCALVFAILGAAPSWAGQQGFDLRLSENLGFHASGVDAVPAARPLLQLRTSNDVSESIIRELVLLKGEAMLGTNYVLGGNGEDSVDCSALVQLMFRTAGIELPRTTRQLVSVGKSVERAQLEPGDLLFYRWKRRTLHVAVYVDEGRILHASPGQREVVVTALNEAWQRRLVTARRLL